MYFEYPALLWLLAVPLLLLALYVYKELAERRPHLRVSTAAPWLAGGGSALAWLRHLHARDEGGAVGSGTVPSPVNGRSW